MQSEATSFFHPCSPDAREQAYQKNQIRFLPLDLCYGCDVSGWCYQYLLDQGMSRQEYQWFGTHGRALCWEVASWATTITQRTKVSSSTTVRRRQPGEIFGYYAITGQYYKRYRLPVMYTETNNLGGHDAHSAGFEKNGPNMVQLKESEVPLLGFTWFSLTDQIDWDTALREDNGRVDPVGLFDLDRKIRPVGADYKKLISQWTKQMNDLPG